MAYRDHIIQEGTESTETVMLYTLSTCIWCRKTKKLLTELGLGYSYIDVDLLDEDDQDEVMAEVEKHNPASSFPTLVVNEGEKVILGFEEGEIRDLT
ncbi:MAG: glutaredoxin family protein [bacterium]